MFICEKKVNTKKNAFFNRLVHAANVVIFSNQSNRLTSIFSKKKTIFLSILKNTILTQKHRKSLEKTNGKL